VYKTIILIIIIFLLYAIASADNTFNATDSEDILRARVILPAEQFAKQNSYSILIELKVGNGWHINSNQPLEEFLIPTEIKFDDTEGISYGKLVYQSPELRNFSFSETKVSVYEGKSYVKTTITINPDFPEEELVIRGTVFYQACNDESCMAPTQISFSKLVTIVSSGVEVNPANEDIFKNTLPLFQETETDGENMGDVLRQSGLLYAFIFIYLGGLALNLTPCVYPLIPITISYFGGQSKGRKSGLIAQAVIYVLGMAVTYSVLGLVAALTGGLLGSALQNPLVLIFVALILIGLALSMFGLYEIKVPQSLAMVGGKNRSGYIGTFLMGLTVGLIAAPCIGPFVLGLLTYVGELGDPFLGFWMFFVLALGLGTPFLFLGIFSGAATNLPRSGAWMIWVRILFGFVLIGMAIYFLEPLFPSTSVYYYTLAFVAVIAGVYLGWIDKNQGQIFFKIARNVTGILFIILGVFLVLPSDSQAGKGIEWQYYTPELLANAQKTNTPVIIDFYADWCIPCKELDKFTFSDPGVKEICKNYVTLKADLTSFQSDATTELKNKFNIKGVLVFCAFAAQGQEIASLRLTGYEDAEKFLERLNKVE